MLAILEIELGVSGVGGQQGKSDSRSLHHVLLPPWDLNWGCAMWEASEEQRGPHYGDAELFKN